MTTRPEERIFEDYLAAKDRRPSAPRAEILDVFLKTDRHLSADELYRMVQKKYPQVGFATVYRTLKLLCECGLGRELRFEDGIARYEHLYGHQHHDHLICTKCGRFVEVVDPEIERLQERLAKRHGFHPDRHHLELYGTCRKCRR